MGTTRATGQAPLTNAEKQARYRWRMQLAATLAKAARLLGERPEARPGAPQPPLPQMPGELYYTYWSEASDQREAAGRPRIGREDLPKHRRRRAARLT
jgi:hypothetical protein